MTVYNRIKLLKRAINSILKQSFKDYELIIVDDGSSYNVGEYIIKMQNKYDFIKYIRHSNRNHYISVNAGISIATGRYITFLDSDDEYAGFHLESRVKYFKRNKNIDLIYSTATLKGKQKYMCIPDARNTNKLIHIKDCIIGATFFGKREVFTELKGYKDKYGADFDFYNRAKKKYNIKKFDLPTYMYYRNSGNCETVKLKKRLIDEKRRILHK